MLQCATAECILRLDRTVLKEEAAEIQAMYLERHCHETLLQFLNYALSQHADSDQALRIQVFLTFHAGHELRKGPQDKYFDKFSYIARKLQKNIFSSNCENINPALV